MMIGGEDMAMLDRIRKPKQEKAQANDQEKAAAFEVLVHKAVKGERKALIELCEQIAKGILYRATLIVGNPTAAEDVSQEVLIRVCENIKYLREPKAFKVWLSKIISNESNRYFTNNSKYGTVLSIDDYLETMTEDKEEFLPHECVENAEARSTVMDAISRLSVRQREAVMLHYYDGLNVTQVADVMGVTKQSVSEYLALSREKLKRELEKAGYMSA